MEIRVREEQRMMDKKIVSEIDQKVIDQQNTLQKAGVPGFYITTNPQVNVQVQALNCKYIVLTMVGLCCTGGVTFLKSISGADDADEPARIDPEASTEGDPVRLPLRKTSK